MFSFSSSFACCAFSIFPTNSFGISTENAEHRITTRIIFHERNVPMISETTNVINPTIRGSWYSENISAHISTSSETNAIHFPTSIFSRDAKSMSCVSMIKVSCIFLIISCLLFCPITLLTSVMQPSKAIMAIVAIPVQSSCISVIVSLVSSTFLYTDAKKTLVAYPNNAKSTRIIRTFSFGLYFLSR